MCQTHFISEKELYMVSITKATEKDYSIIKSIGKVSVWEAHKDSCSAEQMNEYLDNHYNDEAIQKELSDPNNIYHIINYNGNAAGFSKIVLNAEHPNIPQKNVTKLDRIYLLKEFYGLKLGLELLQFNIELSKANGQSGLWLFTWVGNKRAVDFYTKTGFRVIGSHQFKVTETHSNENYHMLLDLTGG